MVGRPKSKDARDRVLRATADIALEAGLASASIDAVARRSGVAKTTIYRHFDDRNAMLISALDGAVTAPRIPDTGTLYGDLVAFYTELVPLFADVRIRTLSLEIDAAAARDPELQALRGTFFSGRMGPVTTIVAQAAERGEITAVADIAEIVEIVHGPLIVRSMTNPDSISTLDPVVLARTATRRLSERE